MRTIHWIMIDCVAAAFATLTGMLPLAHPYGLQGWALPSLLAIAALTFVPVALRRLAPVTAFGTLLALTVIMAGTAPGRPALLFPAAYVLYTVTVVSARRTGAAALILGLTVTVLAVADGHPLQPAGHAGSFVPAAFAMVIAWMTGYSVRQRRLYAQLLQEQAASSAVAEERLRIARELHDVVAHSMSVIAVQAGYGQYVIDASPASARDALGAIQATSRDALEEMRGMLGVLRQRDAASPGRHAGRAPLAPAPGLGGLDRLVQRTRGAGVEVSLEISGPARPAPASGDLAAYRIIQEALTNVVKHAGTGAACTVSLRYTDADLIIGVTDDGGRHPAPPAAATAGGTGHGIIGMRERVHLCGGTFSAGPRAGRGFQVTATLPLPAAVPAVPAGDAALARGGQR